MYAYDDDLYHFGIKGQKWGVRRFQDKSGRLTAAGKKRYSDDSSGDSKSKTKKTKEKSNHRLRLEKEYREKGHTKQEAEAAADKRIKVEKAVAITAGLTVTACAAYYAKNKWTQTYCDQVLKSGTKFHNLDAIENERPGEHLYVNYRKNDNDYFRGKFAINKLKRTGHVYDHSLEAVEDIKIPSVKTRKDTFKQLYENDEEFRNAFTKHSRNKETASAKKVYKDMWMKFGDKDTPEFNVAKRKYFDALRDKGYEAIVDEWDTNPRVFRSDAPLILLNTSSKSLGKMTIKELTAKEILISQANSRNYEISRDPLTQMHMPHTNHFNESTNHLLRYTKKNGKNTEYINKALDEMKKRGYTDEQITNLALKRSGARISDVGKLMTKYKNMDLKTATNIASAKKIGRDLAETGLYIGLGAAPTYAIGEAINNTQVEKYIADHPRTKMSVAEIEKKVKTGQL